MFPVQTTRICPDRASIAIRDTDRPKAKHLLGPPTRAQARFKRDRPRWQLEPPAGAWNPQGGGLVGRGVGRIAVRDGAPSRGRPRRPGACRVSQKGASPRSIPSPSRRRRCDRLGATPYRDVGAELCGLRASTITPAEARDIEASRDGLVPEFSRTKMGVRGEALTLIHARRTEASGRPALAKRRSTMHGRVGVPGGGEVLRQLCTL